MNKIIIVLLVVLLCLTGGIGYYSFTLDQRVDSLNQKLTAYEVDQANQVSTLTTNLTNLTEQSAKEVGDLQTQLQQANVDISAQKSELASAQNELASTRERIASAEGQISTVGSQVESLNKSVNAIASAQANVSQSVINANQVFEKVSRATVRITNGQATIGSGFISDTEGHVITAFHVIDGLSPISVIMDDGRVSGATVTGSSEASDVAMLKLATNPSIEPAPLGDSSQIKIGEPVVALGSPNFDASLGLEDTLTAGIISQINRFTDYGLQSPIPNLLQFDAPVNPGNSGGPLVNARGEVVGIVVAHIQVTEGEGIAYAVSSNKVKRVAAAIIARGSFAYPWIGVGIADLTPELASGLSLETINGVIVDSVFSGSPAEAAGFRADDVIVGMDGVALNNTGELTSYLGENKSPGDTSKVEVIRGGARLEITVVVGTR